MDNDGSWSLVPTRLRVGERQVIIHYPLSPIHFLFL